VVGSFHGNLEMRHNCFEMNEASIAPVITEAGTHLLSSNYGKNKYLDNPICEFVITFPGIKKMEAETTQINEIPFSCTGYDGVSCTEDVFGVSAGSSPSPQRPELSLEGEGPRDETNRRKPVRPLTHSSAYQRLGVSFMLNILFPFSALIWF
jgi:hypothetical protein